MVVAVYVISSFPASGLLPPPPWGLFEKPAVLVRILLATCRVLATTPLHKLSRDIRIQKFAGRRCDSATGVIAQGCGVPWSGATSCFVVVSLGLSVCRDVWCACLADRARLYFDRGGKASRICLQRAWQ